MDWTLAIEKNREALRRILAMLVTMLGTGSEMQAEGRPITLPRHLHRFALRLLRPAEAAARRLIIVAARGLVVEIAPPRPRPCKPQPEIIYVLDRVDGSIVSVPMVLPRPPRAPERPQKPGLSLPLFDPYKRWGRRRWVKQAGVPYIIFDFDRTREPDPPPPSSDDPLDAGRLNRRLAALAMALDNLPLQANRLARWQARRSAQLAEEGIGGTAGVQRKGRFQRISPMRPGRPPGWRRRSSHPVDDILKDLHGLAVWARDCPDTS